MPNGGRSHGAETAKCALLVQPFGGGSELTRCLLPKLINGAPGKVVNLSSRLASMVIGAETCWDIGYNASKAALNAITVCAARLLSDSGVIVVAVHPGLVRTGMGGPQASIERKMQLASSQAPSLNSARNTAACFCKATAHPIPGESSARFTGRRAHD